MRVVGQSLAKLNLTLHITGRREDGYHQLQSLVAFTEVGDELTVQSHAALSLTVNGPQAVQLGHSSENSILVAASRLRETFHVDAGAQMTLTKVLPVASGIGGGSGDAALALRLLAELWGIKPTHAELSALALSIGADVPVCLHSVSGWMEGIGEQFQALHCPLPESAVVLINPLMPLPTPQVFAHYRRQNPPFSSTPPLVLSFADVEALIEYVAAQRNDLTHSACEIMPEIST
ncbi:MAG: 4-(cytidine 5'-diphospho)-2-C-methyl-D-erythritol kinase, partial [Rickettsiales bacterium]|nr:4-(cytidine 5'-diphospho)-2-C-methyl-D-erythritol kinase [Rickettsiales bacterium]